MLADIIPTDSRQYILKRPLAILLYQPILRFFVDCLDASQPLHFQFPVQALAADKDIDIPFMNLEIAPDFTASRSSSSEIQPIARRVSCTAGHDVHNLAAFQFVVQRHHACYKPLAIAHL